MKIQPKRKTVWSSGHWGALCAFALLWVFTRCSLIDREMEDCYTGAYLRFEYVHPQSREDLLHTQIDKLELYVYDENGDFYTMRPVPLNTLPDDNTYSLEWLPTGDYTILTWTFTENGEGTRYIKEYDGHITQMRYGVECEDDQGTLTTRPGHLFYGKAAIHGTEAEEEYVVSLQKNSNDIRIVLESEVGKADLPEMATRMTLRNGSYNHENSLAPEDGRPIQYHAAFVSKGEEGPTAALTILRLRADEQDTRVVIYDPRTQAEYLNADLIAELLKGNRQGLDPQEYLDLEDEFILTYEYTVDENGTGILSLVKVNDWELTPGHGGI